MAAPYSETILEVQQLITDSDLQDLAASLNDPCTDVQKERVTRLLDASQKFSNSYANMIHQCQSLEQSLSRSSSKGSVSSQLQAQSGKRRLGHILFWAKHLKPQAQLSDAVLVAAHFESCGNIAARVLQIREVLSYLTISSSQASSAKRVEGIPNMIHAIEDDIQIL